MTTKTLNIYQRINKVMQEVGYLKKDFSFDKVRVERANIDTPQLPSSRLEKLVAREQLMSRMYILIKHPFRIIKKYISYFKKDRRIVFNFIRKNIVNSLKKT